MTGVRRETARFDVLDFYRYAGALVVALDHFSLVYLPGDYSIKSHVHLLLQPLMGFFFTLSGFVIMHVYGGKIFSIDSYAKYLIKRVARVYPLHILTLCFAIILGLIGQDRGFFIPMDLIQNILLIHAWNTTRSLSFNYPSWSVSAEIFVYLLFPAFFFVTSRAGSAAAVFLPLACAAVVAWFFDVCGIGEWTTATYDFGCLRAAPSFIAGMVTYQLVTVQFARLPVPAWVAHGLAIATIPMMLIGCPGELMLAVFVLVVFLLARAEPANPGILSKRLPRALTDCSYGFYMLHALVASVVLGFIPKLFHLGPTGRFALTPIAIVATTTLAVLSFRMFEDPARRYISALRLPRFQRATSQTLPKVLN